MRVNKKAVQHARQLIKDGKYRLDTDWGDDQPSNDDENTYREKHSWSEYGQWFLGIDTDENEETKGHYKFPYGDFKKIHRAGLIAAKQRAAQNDYGEIEKAADELIDMIDKREEK